MFAYALYVITQKSPVSQFIQSYKGFAAPFFVPIAAIFALFAVFLTNDIWVRAQDRTVELEQSLQHEIGALRVLQRLAVNLGESGADIIASVRSYIATSNADGWDVSVRGGSRTVDEKLQALVTAILDRPESTRADVQTQMLSMYATIERARAERSAFRLYETDIYKWVGMMLLGFLTQVAIAMVHIDIKKAQAASLLLFSLAFSVTIMILGTSENVVSGLNAEVLSIHVSPDFR
jgi:hypothetical protein